MLSQKPLSIAFLAVGSHSDDPKVVACKVYLESCWIFVFDGVKSAHRTPSALNHLAMQFPLLPESVKNLIWKTNVHVWVVIGAAWWAAHLPGGIATHNFYTPVIALPVWSDTFAKVFGTAFASLNALESMHDMPPEVPNGLAPNPEIAWRMAEKIIKLDIPTGYNKVAIPKGSNIDPTILESLWLEIDPNSPIQIVLQDIDNSDFSIDPIKIQIIIPTATPVWEGETRNIGETLNRLNAEWLYMGWQVGRINYLNALIFAAQILASHGNETIVENLIDRRIAAHDAVRNVDKEREWENARRLRQIMKLYETWLWPAGKPMNLTRGDERLESLGYVRFYTGKNADLYVIPDREPLEVLMVRTDRTSVFNIPLDLEIKGKWEVQNQISILGARFAESHGMGTTMRELPDNMPEELRWRSQAIELCEQLEVEVSGRREWMELIFRNFGTGTLIALLNGKSKFQAQLISFIELLTDYSITEVPVSMDSDGNIILNSSAATLMIPSAHSRYYDFPAKWCSISIDELNAFLEASKNPYQVDLPNWLKEWDDLRIDWKALFTPTDKTEKDNPIPSHIVMKKYPELVIKLQELFREFTQFANERGYVIIDTKFEVFVNSKWEIEIGDEILTPESSRFIKREDFEAGIYISADKQMIRNLWKQFKWEERFAALKEEAKRLWNPEPTVFQVGNDVTEVDKNAVLAGYTSIQAALS